MNKARMLKVTSSSNAQLYWGISPIPEGAVMLGLVDRGGGDVGALIRLSSGVLVQGNARSIRSLPQSEARSALRLTGVECA